MDAKKVLKQLFTGGLRVLIFVRNFSTIIMVICFQIIHKYERAIQFCISFFDKKCTFLYRLPLVPKG